MRAIILSIGDELTLGQTLDTNSMWLSAALAEKSVLVSEHRTLADDRAALAKAIGESVAACDVLITTGGLGPTADDLTREAVGDVATPGEALVEDAEARGQLNNWFTRRGRPMPHMNLKQALRPGTFRCLANPNGTAPGLAGEIRGCRVFCLPGPPREMQPMFREHVLPALPASDGNVLLSGMVQEFGMGESIAADKIADLMRRDANPLVGTTASESIVSARIRVQGPADWAKQQLADTVQRVREAWRPYAFATSESSLSEALGQLLQERGLRLATAESCTGGALGKHITDRAGSSAYYLGGWVTYANAMKMAELGVRGEMLDRHGAVSAEVVRAMAEGALQRSGADCALAITGVAGPDGGTKEKPVGTVFVAAAINSAMVLVRHFQFPGERAVVRDRSVKAAMQLLRFTLLGAAKTPLLWEMVGQRGAKSSDEVAA